MLWLRRCVLLLLALVLIGSRNSTNAQVRPSRTWESTPVRTGMPCGVMPSLLGGGEFQRSWGSTFGEQAWQFRTHVQVEPYRFTDSSDKMQWTTTIEAHQEMTANPLNDISFNPRTMRWEEYFWLHLLNKDVSARIGFLHRCKHDIDNLAGADEFNPISPMQAEQRTIILTGPTVAATLSAQKTPFGWLTLSGGVEWFLNSSDNRRPASGVASWDYMIGAGWFRLQNITRISPSVAMLATAFASVPWFEARPRASSHVPYDARAELALSLTGITSRIDIAVVTERTFDELAMTLPESSSYVGLCVRFMPHHKATE